MHKGVLPNGAWVTMPHVNFIYDFSTYFITPNVWFHSEGVRERGSNLNSPYFTRWSSLAPSHHAKRN